MSHSHYIRLSLNIKDENIVFSHNFISEMKVKGITSKVYHAALSYQPTHCDSCGALFDEKITKHGFKQSRIVLPKTANYNTYLLLKKQRYFCAHCQSTFSCKTSLVDSNCFISTASKQAIFLDAQHKKSECDLARDHNVSHCTVSRVINAFYEEKSVDLNYLPATLCFDEFKSVKHAKGAMSFIFCDGESGEIIDILEDRTYNNLYQYFMRFPKETRLKVKHVVIDMYTPYMKLIKAVFPTAKIILDKFHVVQLISRALNKTRIAVMNQHKNTEYYPKLKRYWKLLLKSENDLNSLNYHYSYSFKKLISDTDIRDYLLSVSPELKDTYTFYQTILHAIQTTNKDLLNHTLEEVSPNVSTYMKTALTSLKKYLPYIENMMGSTFTNGVLEGINNKIKVIKRIAFGYRSFYHFKARILIIQTQSILNKKHQKKHPITA